MAGKSFDIGDGIFFFFKRFGQNPAGAMWIALWQLIFGAAASAAVFYFIWPFYSDLIELIMDVEAGRIDDDQAAFGILRSLFGVYSGGFVAVLVGIVASLMFQGAWLRFLVRREVAPVIPFRFGGDEFRLLGVNIMYIVVVMAAYFGIVTLLITLGLSSGGLLAVMGGDEVVTAIGTGLVVSLGMLGVFIGAIFLMVKLSSAPALTIHDRKFRFFESWEATNGVFLPMAVSYAVVGILIMILSTILSAGAALPFLGGMLAVAEPLSEFADANIDPTFEDVMAMLRETFLQPVPMTLFAGGFALFYIMQIVFEGMWHSVAAYNVVRHRADGAGEEGDAPVLGKDHPMGASPSEG
ncbi:hypothetical protein [Maricaulis sp.]|uniref:hypothetical protein n=1 Tax=Maricaulis sp. TaxID=1486257 RepID=UPI001B05C59F|nr:hypothetical protein [Maricaulis sp.]MBO6797011.1 hypothetical protein [Maricaulis sp.]